MEHSGFIDVYDMPVAVLIGAQGQRQHRPLQKAPGCVSLVVVDGDEGYSQTPLIAYKGSPDSHPRVDHPADMASGNRSCISAP